MASAKHLNWQLVQGGGVVQDVLHVGVHLRLDVVNAPDLTFASIYVNSLKIILVDVLKRIFIGHMKTS